ncbi:hypothetical protein PRIPAC_91078 [Pristionchus pacificus]|uniref:Uncharacterized protein n=1 Tax=Pristionchus pacificus TaxID=54126 RepID=A0A2A6B636_PRIPA|nr:hypothetical protein PRIPAC_91078 [Pristionchus pacificus]|eukprot:PDM61313.1 hypothetical protein PRIPAC_50755 [Pristionchus pacificus]
MEGGKKKSLQPFLSIWRPLHNDSLLVFLSRRGECKGSRPVRRPMVNKTSISAFGGSIILVFIFTTIALFTPGWRYFRNGGPQLGLVTYHCGSGIREVNFRDCKDWYNARWIFERAALAFMILAFLFEIAAIGIFVILFVKANRVIGGAAAMVSLLICASLFIAILVYGINFQSKPVYIRSNTNEMNGNSILGYAYWLALTAFILSIIPLVSSGAIPSSIPSSNPHNPH